MGTLKQVQHETQDGAEVWTEGLKCALRSRRSEVSTEGVSGWAVNSSSGLTCRKDLPSDALKGSSGCSSHPALGRAAEPGPRCRRRPEFSWSL